MLNDDQQMIRDAAETFLADVSHSAAIRSAMDSAPGYDPSVWSRIGAELGWCGIGVDEAHSGLGLGVMELALVQEQAGRHLLSGPFFATGCVAATVLRHCGDQAAMTQWLPRIAEGTTRFAVPLNGLEPEWEHEARRLRATPDGNAWRLTGEALRLSDAAQADHLLLLAQLPDDSPALFIVAADAARIAITPRRSWDATRRFADVVLCNAPVLMRVDDPDRLSAGLITTAAWLRICLAAELLGVAQQCLDLTVAYVATRKQFGRAVGGFQAVKHRCAEMMVRVESLRSAVYGVAQRAGGSASPEALHREGMMVKAWATDTAFYCAQEAIQLHGGVGFTWEYDPQLYFKRAQAAQHWMGTPDELREVLADELLDTDALPAPGGEPSTEEANDDRAFRADVNAWMQAHLSGPFADLQHRGGPGDEEHAPALRKDWERELAKGGWTCVGWPRAHGGRELSIQQQVIFHEEYARAGGPGRMGHIGEGLIGPAIIAYGTPEQQQRFLPDIVAGRTYWAQGYSEPSAGSDLANVQTKAVLGEDGRWRVSGQKIWTSLAHESDWIFVLARSEPGSKGNKGLIFLLMKLDQPGIDIRPIRQISGGCEFNEVFFDEAICEAGDVLGAPGDGWKVAMGLLEIERGVSTLGQQMHFAFELETVVAAAKRSGRICQPAMRSRIAQAWMGLVVMRDNALRMLADGSELGLRREALIYKYYWSNWHRDLGKLAMDVLGPEGSFISDDPVTRPLQQLFFFSRADTIYAGTNEIQLNLIAERGLGMPREVRPTS
nr:acyl-CoA dehydrogenase [Polycyclovorans algicola]